MRRPVWRSAPLIGVLFLLVVASCGGGGGFTLHGTLTVQLIPCRQLASRVSDAAPGATVVVKNDKGAIVATGSLGTGVDYNYPDNTGGDCRVPFTVSGVPKEKFYSVEVANRGAQTYSAADLAAKHNTIQLTLPYSGN